MSGIRNFDHRVDRLESESSRKAPRHCNKNTWGGQI
jgi:hypothetical protein